MEPKDQMKLADARNGFTGKSLSDSQFDESWALAGILHRAIRKSGSFHEKLTDYSFAFARAEKFDQMKGESILRDQFKARYGQTLNQMREDLKAREANLSKKSQAEALAHARLIEPLIRDGATMPFYRAYDHVGGALAEKLDITETGAKELMKSVYQEAEGRDLYETCKALEKTYYEPARDAAKQTQDAQKQEVDVAPKKARSRARV
jgi:hypothetical protein